MAVVLVHGFNVKDGGKATIDKLKEFFSTDYEVLEADYGRIGLLGVRFYNDNLAAMLAGMTPKGSIGVGHSNGCALLVRAARRNPRAFKRLILINPALDRDVEFPESLETIDVIYTEEDKAVALAKWLPFHEWGDMGKVGYTGKDLRVVNWNATTLLNAKLHSGVFNKEIDRLMQHILLTHRQLHDAY